MIPGRILRMSSTRPADDGRTPLVRAAADLADLLGRMFDDPGLVRLRSVDPAHPAVRHIQSCEEICVEGTSLPASQNGPILDVLRAQLDYEIWAPSPAPEDFWSFLPDDETRRRTVAAFQSAEQFPDAIAELFYWGWLIKRDFNAQRVEQDGLSDIAIDLDSPQEVRVEVKRLRSKSRRRVSEVVRDANRQIRRSEPPGGGVLCLLLDIPMRPSLRDDVPAEVGFYVDEVTRATQHDNSNVGHVVVSWDEFLLPDDPYDSGKTSVIRRSLVVSHANPRIAPRLSSREISVHAGATALHELSLVIIAKQTPEDLLLNLDIVTVANRALDTIRVDPRLFGAVSRGPEAVRPSHVLAAFARPDASAVHLVPDGFRAVVTKRVTTDSRDFVLVLRGLHRARPERWLVQLAWRLFDTPGNLERLQANPNEAFAAVLQRYGIRFRSQHGKAWWVPQMRIQLSVPYGFPLYPADLLKGVVSATGLPSTVQWDAISPLSISVSPSHEVTASDMFFIDYEKYRAELIRSTRTSGPRPDRLREEPSEP
jgi:hypothetical protein